MQQPDPTIRLDSYLARLGVASRRGIAQFLNSTLVTVNGQRIFEPGMRINPGKDVLLVNNQPLNKPQLVYYILYKPKGYISTADDEKGRKTVLDLVNTPTRVFPVGRLDKDTTGIILLTNDGELANKLIHPRFHVPKTYHLLIDGQVSEFLLNRLRTGIKLEEGKTLPAEVRVINQTNRKTTVEMTIYEGKKRQIRRMCEALELPLEELKRVTFGPIVLGKLQPGNFRQLRKDEVQLLKTAVQTPHQTSRNTPRKSHYNSR